MGLIDLSRWNSKLVHKATGRTWVAWEVISSRYGTTGRSLKALCTLPSLWCPGTEGPDHLEFGNLPGHGGGQRSPG
jgi:hypothetical protein